ncbi:fasciclin-like arabinogalactan protein 11 [Primulina tabacum]|uniref:fasciclin-like arabinogalactan protein 11 n=1 Tax=Primulina tabacum TaxID=48773 RepID=UPI003F5A2574
MDQKITLISLPYAFSLLLLLQCTKILAQPPATSPSGPTNITRILEKAGQFTTFIRLLQITRVGDQIDTQLNNSNQGLTVFAPTDNAFSSLQPGTLNTLTNQDKVALVQFHVLPTFLSMSQFQTVSNPLRTQVGDTRKGEFPLNVTTTGNQVNISTGVSDVTLGNTVYADNQLAVYQVDKVLLPLSIFGPSSPAPAPVAGGTENKKATGSPSAAVTDSSWANGDAVHGVVAFGAALFGIFYL